MMRAMFELEKPTHPLELARQGSRAAGGGAVAGALLGAAFGAIAGAVAGVTVWSAMKLSQTAWRRYWTEGALTVAGVPPRPRTGASSPRRIQAVFLGGNDGCASAITSLIRASMSAFRSGCGKM